MSGTGWEQWRDSAGSMHMKVVLTDHDVRRMDPAQLAMLVAASSSVADLAFAEDTPQALTDLRAELRAEKGDGPQRLADLCPDELRGFLQRMRGVA